MAVASAAPYASLHLTPDRQPCQHPTTQFFTGRMLFLPPIQQRQSTEGSYSNRSTRDIIIILTGLAFAGGRSSAEAEPRGPSRSQVVGERLADCQYIAGRFDTSLQCCEPHSRASHCHATCGHHATLYATSHLSQERHIVGEHQPATARKFCTSLL